MEKVFNAYSLDVGQLADGDYKAIAITNSNGKSLQSEVRFSVKPIDIETMRLQADHGMLANLAKISGGKMVLPKQINSLENEILNNKSIKPIVYDFYKTKSLIDLKWLFFIAIFCLLIKCFRKSIFIYFPSFLIGNKSSKIHWKSIGVIQFKNILTIDGIILYFDIFYSAQATF